MLNGWVSNLNLGVSDWLHALPIGELGGTLFGAGLLSTLFEYTLLLWSVLAHPSISLLECPCLIRRYLSRPAASKRLPAPSWLACPG